MRIRYLFSLLVGAAVLLAVPSACATRANYVDPDGPRYAADYALRSEVVALAVSETGAPEDRERWMPAEAAPVQTLKVVSYNVRYGLEVDAAIEVLSQHPELANADVFVLQEMHGPGVDRIARALGCSYVYYPASLRTSGRDFGNAVLTRGRIVGDEKILLPHVNPFNRQQRIAVRTDLEVGGDALAAYSVHTETPFLPARSRVDQIDALLSSVPQGSLPCLIAGDFNTMSKRCLERFETRFAGQGFQRASANIGSTFSFGPLDYPMDHVFVRGLEVVGSGKVEDAGVGDHVPIWVEFAWDQQAEPSP